MRILEIGSREVMAKSNARKHFSQAEYVGFDYYTGDNVDVIGDAHKLSDCFEENSFDLVYSSASFEHFAMPWLVAQEIAKILKLDGIVFVETHFSFSSHERLWHFFYFSDMALKALFSDALALNVSKRVCLIQLSEDFHRLLRSISETNQSAACIVTANIWVKKLGR